MKAKELDNIITYFGFDANQLMLGNLLTIKHITGRKALRELS